MEFYKAILVPITNPMAEAYGAAKAEKLKESGITLESRLLDCACEQCGGKRWFLLPKESVSIKEGGKPYIECLDCGFNTHL